MWYRYYLTVPRGTTAAAPARKEIGLPEGVIKGVRVRFPPGPRGQVFTAVFQGTHKMWPRGEGNYAWGDNEPIEMEEYVKNIKGWHWFLEGYAPDTGYNHTIWWDFNMLEYEYANPLDPVVRFVKLFEELIGMRRE